MENNNLMSFFGEFDMNPKTITLGELHELYDITNRRIFLNGDICNKEETALSIIPSIMQYNKIDEKKGIPIEERVPIKLYINSNGGEIHEGFSIIDAIELSKTPVWTINIGVCMSMAFHIFIAGDKRFAFPSAIFLHHDGSDGIIESSSKFQDHANFLKKFGKTMKEQVLRCTKITDKLFEQNKRVEWYMQVNEAKKYGVLDYVIGENPDFDKQIIL